MGSIIYMVHISISQYSIFWCADNEAKFFHATSAKINQTNVWCVSNKYFNTHSGNDSFRLTYAQIEVGADIDRFPDQNNLSE